jgi:hypothetical protein
MTMTTSALADTRRGPIHRHEDGGHLWYRPPGKDLSLISVTSVFDFIAKEQLDKRWRPSLAAKAAFAELPRLVAAIRVKVCGRTNNRCDHDFRVSCVNCPCGDCKECLIRWMTYQHYAESRRATDRGIAVHDWIQQWVLYEGRVSEPDEAIAPYIATFRTFLADMGLTPNSWELSETTVLNYTDGWGGTLDAHLRFDATATTKARAVCAKFGMARPLVAADVKTREADNATFWPDNAKQLAAYLRGEVILFPDGREEPLPRADGGLVLQLRQDGYGWRRVDTSDRTYAAFLANKASAMWEIEHGAASTQVKSFPDLEIPDLPEPVKPVRRSTPRANGATTKKPVPAAATRAGSATLASLRTRPAGAQLTDDDLPF